jgi:hypothetical protein
MRLQAQFGILLMLASLPVCASIVAGGDAHLPRFFLQKTAQGQSKGTEHEAPVQPGKWLQKFRDLPPDQRLKALESDPDFKKLTPEQQQALRDRLHHFNSLPQEEQDRRAKWIEVLGSLPPEQRHKIQTSAKQLQELPDDRKNVVRRAVKDLSEMTEAQRNSIMQSDKFKQTFSDNERDIIATMVPPRALMQEKTGAVVGSGAPTPHK